MNETNRNNPPGPTASTRQMERRVPGGKKIGIFIIAYNAEAHIEATLARIPASVWEEIEEAFVFDDCSTDDTVKRALALRERYPKLVVLRNRTNNRYGGNQKLGWQYALERGLDAVVMLHADGQYAPEILSDLYRPIVDGRADVVLGSRMLKKGDARRGGMPRYKYFGNIVLTRIQNALTGVGLSEFHTGYRAYSTRFLRAVPFRENSDEWHFDTEILLQAAAAGARILEVPIPTYYGNEICHVNGIEYAFQCIRTSFEYFLMRKGFFYRRSFDVNLAGQKYFGKFDDPYSSHSMVLSWLEKEGLSGKGILELGVGDASLTEKMAAAGADVVCVEIDEESGRLALPHAREVLQGNVEELDFRQSGRVETFDLCVAADILEHLVHPETTLSKVKIPLKPNGRLIVSLPNVANAYVRLNLLLGRFPYYRKGILDATHLHSYTLKSMKRLLEQTGWIVEKRAVTSIPIAIVVPFLRKWPFRWIIHLWHGLTVCFPGLLGYQGLFLCRNPNSGELL